MRLVGQVLAVIVAIPFGWTLGVVIARFLAGPNFGQLPLMTVPIALVASIAFAVSRFRTAWTRLAIMLMGTVLLALVIHVFIK